ncbi:hypothetical protein NHQ30_005618 [Ciborinia camelliae]|nr:hypothetical protein NHQ30_005618 [Ciborinia camelliae]
MKRELNLELFDLGRKRLEASIQRKLAIEKYSITDRLTLAVSFINKTIAEQNTEKSLDIPMQELDVFLKTSFNEDKFVADARASALSRKVEATSELENKISETLGFQSSSDQKENAMARENVVLKKKIGLFETIASHSLVVREGFFESGKQKYVDGEWIHIEGRGSPDQDIRIQRNRACHEGHIDADFAHCKLFNLDQIDGEFRAFMAFSPCDYEPLFNTSRKLSDMYNMRATMFRFFYETEYTYNKSRDKRFNDILAECKKIYNALNLS